MKLNERVWAGQLISWIQEAILQKTTIFQDATNDAGIKLETGKTKFPDVLLFTDKISGIIFNGWELKFPDTAIDDKEMLENALEKAKHIKSDSFVTWNGTEAVIWKIENEKYNLENIIKIKEYPREKTISKRNDLADPVNYKNNEKILRNRLHEILHDLELLLREGDLKEAINVSDNFTDAIRDAAKIIIPQFKEEIISLKGKNASFRKEFNQWKIYESATLKILASSSRRAEKVIEEEVLAKFTFYNLIGKILFYLTLSENLSGSLSHLEIKSTKNIKDLLEKYFNNAQRIDYQAVFKPYFTDKVSFSQIVNKALFELFKSITEYDFKVLPTDVIGTILGNLVPKEEKQKFGQYFTRTTLANLVAFPAIQTANDNAFDPTSGTGTFLNSFYQILKYHGNTNHIQLLNQIWGNDISHFPAILSVINLYKQKVNQPENFPRVTREDYFNLEPKMVVFFPDSKDYKKQIQQSIPLFDSIASNFPFIQQEDIPNDVLTLFFREKFEAKQKAFLKDNSFKINERSDYFTYCIYNSVRFLKQEGILSAITSNAWLGKEYGFQFKKFLLDNFHIKYVVKSISEHWFSDSKVSTIFSVLQHGQSKEATKFITVNFKLEEYFNQENTENQLKQIENFYSDIDFCTDPKNKNWKIDKNFNNLYHKKDNSISVSIVAKQTLENSLTEQENWGTYFISSELFEKFDEYLTQLYPDIIDAFRGERTGWNEMFVLSNIKAKQEKIESDFLIPYVKSPTELEYLEFDGNYSYYLFVCDLPLAKIKQDFPNAYKWIQKFKNAKNKNGSKTIQEANEGHRPFWYSLNPKSANIITAINPYERFFFSYSADAFTIDQRLVAITVNKNYDVELIAALLNSIITLLTIEMRGTSRNLGALDLNANYFKSLKILNPDLLDKKAIVEIKKAFQPLKTKVIGTVFEELKKQDRINFDKIVLKSFGIDTDIISSLYQILSSAVYDRVTMKDR